MLYKFLRLKVNIYRYFEFQSNTTTDSLSNHLYTNVMICKLRKLILEVSVELKIYFIYTAGSQKAIFMKSIKTYS